MSVEKKNREIVFSLVKSYFGLSNDSLVTFEKELYYRTVDEVYAEYLKNSTDLRYEIPLKDDKILCLIDDGWKSFQSHFPSFVLQTQINYSDFRRNKIKIGKQEIRLRKALITFYTGNYEVKEIKHLRSDSIIWFVDDMLAEIREIKLPNKKSLQLVLSLNFADWLLCATAENWTSCLSLSSNYEGAYWTGLPGLIVDKNRAMLYLTDKTKKEFMGIKVDKVLSRSWVLLGDNNLMNLVRFYPMNFFTKETLNYLFEKEIFAYLEANSEFVSKNKIDFLNFKNGNSAYIYQDYTSFHGNRIVSGPSGFWFLNNNKNIVNADVFNFSYGLKKLVESKVDIIEFMKGSICEKCGATFHRDLNLIRNGLRVCNACYNYTRTCHSCGEIFFEEEGEFVENRNWVCYSCIERYFGVCDKCNETTLIDNTHYIDELDLSLCSDCINSLIEDKELFYCSSCCDYVSSKHEIFLEETDEKICACCLKNIIDRGQLRLDFRAA